MIIILLICTFSAATYAITYKYDSLGRLIGVEYNSGQKINYTYDPGGNILNVDVSSPLKLKPIDNIEISENEEVNFKLEIEEPGSNNTLTFSSDNLPEGAELDSETSDFNWIPSYEQANIYNIIFVVTDGTNTDTTTVTIKVNNVNRAPIANAGEDQVVECTSIDGAEVILNGSNSYDPDYDENSEPQDGDRIISYLWMNGSTTYNEVNPVITLPLGEHTFELTVSDSLLESTDEVNIAIQDTTAPKLIIPGDIIKEATGVTTDVDIGIASATDIFDVQISNNAPDSCPMGITEVVWSAVDVNGNETTNIQKINIIDTTPPILTVPDDITISATGERTEYQIDGVMATDLVDQDVSIISDAPDTYPLGETIVTFIATDNSGNSVSDTVKVNVVDDTPPVINVLGINNGEDYTDTVTPIISIKDNESGINQSSITLDGEVYNSGTEINVKGEHILVVSATDNTGNVSEENIKFSIYKNSNIKVISTSVEYSDECEIKAILKSDNEKLDNKKLKFNLNGLDIGTAKTNENGEAVIRTTVLYEAGDYDINVVFAQDYEDYIRNSIGIGTLNVLLEKTSIDFVSEIPITYSETISLKAKVIEEDDGLYGDLSKAKVGFDITKINADLTKTFVGSCIVECDENGEVCLSEALDVGIYEISLNLLENGYYQISSNKVEIPIYNPESCSLSGGGWFIEPDSDDKKDKINIALNANYKKGNFKGKIEINFHEDKMKFKSKNLSWVVVDGNEAQLIATGELYKKGNNKKGNKKDKHNDINEFTVKVNIIDNGNGNDVITIYMWEGTEVNGVLVYKVENVVLEDGNIKVDKGDSNEINDNDKQQEKNEESSKKEKNKK
jgi:YD repeat-containing protein